MFIIIPTSCIFVIFAAAVVNSAMLLPPPSPRILRLSHLYSTPTQTRSYHRRHHHFHHHHPSIFQSHPRPPSSSILMLGNTITTNNFLVMTGRSYDGRISSKLLVRSWSIATSSSSSSSDWTPCGSRLRNSRSSRSSSSSSSSSTSQEPPIVQDRSHAHNNNNNCRHPESMDPIVFKVDHQPQVNNTTPDVPTRDTTTTTATSTTTSTAIPSQRWFVAKYINKRTRQRISNVFSIVGFISSATRSLLLRRSSPPPPPTLIRQQYQDTVQALQSFLQSTQIDLELIPVLNRRFLDNLILLSICEAIIIHCGQHDRRDGARVTTTVDTTTTNTLAAATTVTTSSTTIAATTTTTTMTTKTKNNHDHTNIPTFADALR
jgi:hypothetical protein